MLGSTTPRPRDAPRSHSPVDDELQALYNSVWAEFDSEDQDKQQNSQQRQHKPSTSTVDKDIDTIYSVYSRDSSDYSSLQTPSASSSISVPSAPPRSAKGHGSIRRLPPTPNDLATPSPTYKMPEPTYYDGSETNSFSPSHYDVRTTNPLNYPYMDDLPAATPRPNPSHAGRHATVYVGNDSDGPRIRYPGGHDTLIEIPPARLVEDAYYTSPNTPRDERPPQLQSNHLVMTNFQPGLDRGSSYSGTLPVSEDSYDGYEAGPSNLQRTPSAVLHDIANYNSPDPQDGDMDDEYWEEPDELRDKVPRGTHVKGSIPYSGAFTGKDIVSTIQSQIQRELVLNHNMSTNDRWVAVEVARSLQGQLFFYEVEWGGRALQDSVEDVYMFLGEDGEGSSSAAFSGLNDELPTGVVTMLSQCYSATCEESDPCYSFSCPRRGMTVSFAPLAIDEPEQVEEEDWSSTVPREILDALSGNEIRRQSVIHKIIGKEEQYLQDLDTIETVFLRPLRAANPAVVPPERLECFIDEVFGNVLDLRECNRRLSEVMRVRQREQGHVIQGIGDVFLSAAAEFGFAYPIYVGHQPIAEKRVKDEAEANPGFRLFMEQCARQSPSRHEGDGIKLDLKHFLNRPTEHLQRYPQLLEAILNETEDGIPDGEYLKEAIKAFKNLQSASQLRTFQLSMGRGVAGKWEWHDLVSADVRQTLPKNEMKRQAVIFELIKGEMGYVKDLQNIETMYIEPLRNADPPIIKHDRLETFIQEVFHNYADIAIYHARLLEQFQEIQREQHPSINTITASMMDAALNFRDAYMEYIPNYPIAAYRIDDEMIRNPAFKAFVNQCVRHPDAHRLDMKSFINRPIPRLLRYELLLKGILEETPPNHDDRVDIPQVLEIIKALGKDTEPGVMTAKQKVELWRYHSNLVFKPTDYTDLDLLDENRSLVHAGKLLRAPDSGLEWNGWTEVYVLLFDNYLVMTKPKERDGNTRYHVNKRPIPLELLTLVNFTDPPTQRSTGILRGLRGGPAHAESPVHNTNGISPESSSDSRAVYPCTFNHSGRAGGIHVLFADSAQSRLEWKTKLDEALGIRQVVQESNKVFEIETLSSDTFLTPSIIGGVTAAPSWGQENAYTGKVTCSVPFNTADGRGLVAVGCSEGVWIGFRHDPSSMRRVLHLKLVTQCAILEDFGIFLVLADKSLFAYHIEALVPSAPGLGVASQVPQKLNGNKDVHFFTVGHMQNRTLIIYMKKKGLDSIFRVLEPIGDKINDRMRAPASLGSRFFRNNRSEWFRIYRDFFLPSESFDLVFLKAKIAILCTKGFEIMDLDDFKSVTIPARDDPHLAYLAKRCDACKPLGMYRSQENEFLLVYDEFGIFVDKHGDPSRSGNIIEWEGAAERVALHHPYIMLFDPRFIEVRHVVTGRLAQIIMGNEVRCIWDGRGASTSASTPTKGAFSSQEGDDLEDAQVHAVMNGPGSVVGTRAIAQHVFELVPTVPLFVPGSDGVGQGYTAPSGFTSPRSATNSFRPSSTATRSVSSAYSPPHSPQGRESWR